jgi:hypothetical protein
MNKREKGGTDNSKDGHSFSRTIDTVSPFLSEKQENCRNKGTCMTDSDPPYKSGYFKSPANSPVFSPCTYPLPYCPENHEYPKQHSQSGYGHPHIPEFSSFIHHRVKDVAGYAPVTLASFN